MRIAHTLSLSLFCTVSFVKHALSLISAQFTMRRSATAQTPTQASAHEVFKEKAQTRDESLGKNKTSSDHNAYWSDTSQEQLFHQVFEAPPDVLLLYDIATKNWVYANQQLAAALELPIGKIEKMGMALFESLLCPEDFSLFCDHLKNCAMMGDRDIFEAEYRFRHANGEWSCFHYRDTVFTRDDEGRPRQMLCAARDITLRKRNEETVRNLEVQAALHHMASYVAYEINQPLANIKNLLFLLRNVVTPDHPDTKYLQWTEDEVERIAQTIRRISTMSQLNW
jgi:PAS domain S-box-containing protein